MRLTLLKAVAQKIFLKVFFSGKHFQSIKLTVCKNFVKVSNLIPNKFLRNQGGVGGEREINQDMAKKQKGWQTKGLDSDLGL